MVKIATKEQGFLISLKSNDTTTANFQWGSWVNIINFDQGSDGILEIDVKCKSLVEILSTRQNPDKSRSKSSDKLSFCDVKPMSHWSQETHALPDKALSESLQNVFKNNPTLNQLYSEKQTHTENWVIARWLELLPVNAIIKNTFVKDHSFDAAKKFVEAILLNDEIK